ncbi:polysaccharide deacetylase family protein [Parachitinimonas caeni]|uniref:Polysaccharide deacetylase family protein n=1 Tax=Parachitinimonas caeni TaxID=3031301 RepID=A0ABT7DUH1_9NEIS|nr:polysaccharide deacetylase family protein [Parachitinimonas caeni]MDK2123721.1 polysaccharide deacetylase family protein [Parachitinimonas caeni]
MLISATTLAADEKSIAITIDDLPLDDNTASIADKERYTLAILESLKRHGVVATAFVNEDKLLVKGEIDRHVALLERWLDAGMQLGNHNFGHLGLWQTALPSYQDAVVRGDTITRW